MRPTFYPRDLTRSQALSSTAKFTVGPYSWRARGGPYIATITATGTEAALWRLLDWARSRVLIHNDDNQPVWWGYVRKIELRIKNITVTVDVDRMSNRVAVGYTLTVNGTASGGGRATTAWSEDTTAIAEFGRKELIERSGSVSAAAAIAKRDWVLQNYKFPAGTVKVDPIGVNNKQAPKVTFTCEGWWWTLDWQYANVPTQLVAAYETIGTLEQTIGRDYDDDANNVVRVAEIITTGPSALSVLQVPIYIKRTGTPSSGLTVSILTVDADDEPDTTVRSASLAAGAIGTSYGWVDATLSSSAALSANTKYAIQISYSGTVNADNYYSVLLDQNQGYAGGVCKKYVTAWAPVEADMPFRLKTDVLVPSDTQILNLARSYGQFFSRVDVDGVTGIELESYRNGDNDALAEVDELMDIGTSTGERMLAEVDSMRQVRIFPMPAEEDSITYLRADGQFYLRNGVKIDPSTCPVGMWARVNSVIPPAADVSRISGLGAFFVEQCEYNPETGKLTYTPLGDDDLINGLEAG